MESIWSSLFFLGVSENELRLSISVGVMYAFPLPALSIPCELGVNRKNVSSSSTLPILLISSSGIKSFDVNIISRLGSGVCFWRYDSVAREELRPFVSNASISCSIESLGFNFSTNEKQVLRVSIPCIGIVGISVVIFLNKYLQVDLMIFKGIFFLCTL